MRRPTLVALVAAGAALLAAPPAGAAVEVTATPPLRPAFDLKVSDYVARCPSGKPLRVFVHASDGDRVSVGGGDRRGGTFEAPVSRVPDRAFTIRVRSGGRSTTHHVRCL